MSTEVNSNWQVDEMGSALNGTLNEDFDAGFNGIGMECNPFNMKLVSSIRYRVAHRVTRNRRSPLMATNRFSSLSDTLLALPTLKNEQSNYENKFANNQNQNAMGNGLGSFSAENGNLAATLQGLANQTMNGNPMGNQQVISNELNGNQSLTMNCAKPNTILSKFSSKQPVNIDLNKLEMMEIKQSIQQKQQTTAVCLNSVVQSLKRSPVESPINLLEMQQQHSPHCNSESSSIKSSISPGTSLSSSPTHYSSNGYANTNVHMLRNSILNEPTISINQSQTSTIPLASFLANSNGLNPNGTFFQSASDKEDSRPIAIVQGKKNRHNLNEDDDEAVGSIKKFCMNGNAGNQLATGVQQQTQQQNQAPLDSSASPNDLRYLMQNAVQSTFGGLTGGNLGNLGSPLGGNPAGNMSGNLASSPCNNLQQTTTNPNNSASLACNQPQQQQPASQQPNAGNAVNSVPVRTSSQSAGTTELPANQQQRTDPANLFSTACCSNAHEDCKPAAQQEYRCGQRHATTDFR